MIAKLHEEGLSVRAIARQTGLNRRTVSKYLRRGLSEPVYGPRKPRGSALDGFKDYIEGRLRAYPGLSAIRLLREITEMGYRGCYTVVREFVRQVRPAEQPGWEHRFETAPGKQAQVDFARFKTTFPDCPEQVRHVWLFSMILGFSRYQFCRFVWRQDMATVVRCHIAAFAALGGVPREILYDQMKTAIVDEDEERGIIYNKTLMALGRHYGFVPRACPKGRAKTKGKVERPYRYVRQDFFLGRSFRDMEDLNAQLGQWLDGVANRRLHGTTRRLVHEAFAEEKPALLALPAIEFGSVLKMERRLSHDGMVSVDGNLYSVPDTTRRRVVEVQMTAGEVLILDDGKLVAVHPVLEGSGERRVSPGHRLWPPPGYRRASGQDREAQPVGAPGESVARRSLAVYEAVAQALAQSRRATP